MNYLAGISEDLGMHFVGGFTPAWKTWRSPRSGRTY